MKKIFSHQRRINININEQYHKFQFPRIKPMPSRSDVVSCYINFLSRRISGMYHLSRISRVIKQSSNDFVLVICVRGCTFKSVFIVVSYLCLWLCVSTILYLFLVFFLNINFLNQRQLFTSILIPNMFKMANLTLLVETH